MSHNRAITYQEIRECQLADFLRIYNESFPIDERRLYADEGELRRFMSAKRGKFHILALNEEDRLLGFISYWQFERYCYIEHFAIDPSERGRRLGSEMLGYVRDNIDSRIDLPKRDCAGLRLVHADPVGGVKDLALQVGQIDLVIIDQRDFSESPGSQIQGCG